MIFTGQSLFIISGKIDLNNESKKKKVFINTINAYIIDFKCLSPPLGVNLVRKVIKQLHKLHNYKQKKISFPRMQAARP